MKKLLVIACIISLWSCHTPKETDDAQKILNSGNITITIEYQGCFGGSTQHINIISKNGIRVLTHQITGEFIETQPYPDSILFDSKKEQILEELIQKGLSPNDSTFCTGQATYSIKTEKHKYQFVDSSCQLNKLVNILTNQERN